MVVSSCASYISTAVIIEANNFKIDALWLHNQKATPVHETKPNNHRLRLSQLLSVWELPPGAGCRSATGNPFEWVSAQELGIGSEHRKVT